MTASSLENAADARWPMHAGRMAFFIAGVLLASWAPLVPYAKERVGIESESTLGFMLLCLGVGSIGAMAVAGTVTSRLGCRRTIMCSGIMGAVMLVCLGVSSSMVGLAASLCGFGVFIGMLDVASNIHAVQVEAIVRRPIMSGFHSLYSVGGFIGAGGVSLLLTAGLSPLSATIAAAAVVLLLVVLLGPKLLGQADREPTPFFILPRGMVLIIGLLSFVMFLVEGAMLDWSAVFLTMFHKVEVSRAGLGYSVFAVAMTCFRAVGDRLVARNKRAVILLGSFVAAGGLFLVALTTAPIAGFLGFVLIGIGAANIQPVLFSEAARQPGMPVQLSLASVSLLGYTGVLAGPALIGFVSSLIGLPATFMLLGVLTLAPGLTSGRIVTPRG